MSRGAYLGVAALLGAIAAAGIVALAVADGLLLQLNLVYTALGLLLFGAIAATGAFATGPFAWVGRLAALAAIAAFAFLMVNSWRVDEFGEGDGTTAKLSGSFAIFSFALAGAGAVLNRVKVDGNRVMAGLVVIALLMMFAVATLLTVAFVGDTGSATFFRVVAIIAVIGTLAASLIPVARGLRRTA